MTYKCTAFDLFFSYLSTQSLLKDLVLLVERDPASVSRLSSNISAASFVEIQQALNKEASIQSLPPVRPTNRQLMLTSLNNGLPFIGFGFIDNSVMILAGDIIDVKLGVTLGVSTMACAGIYSTDDIYIYIYIPCLPNIYLCILV
jgi:hypothetical protein